MADLHIKVGGAWKAIDTVYVKVAGAWKTVDTAYIKTAAAWKTAWENVVYSLSNIGNYNDEGATTTTYSVTVWFRTDGTVDIVRNIGGTTNDVETFVVPTSFATSLFIRCTQTAGTALNLGDTLSTYHALSTQRSFGLSYTSSGGFDQVSATLTFDLATDSGGTNVVATKTGCTLTVGETA